MRRLFGHAAAAAARAEAPPFAREGHQALEARGGGAHAREAAGERAAAEEVAELALDEARHAGAVGGGGHLCEEVFEVGADDLLQYWARCRARLVKAKNPGGPSERRAAPSSAGRTGPATVLPPLARTRPATAVEQYIS